MEVELLGHLHEHPLVEKHPEDAHALGLLPLERLHDLLDGRRRQLRIAVDRLDPSSQVSQVALEIDAVCRKPHVLPVRKDLLLVFQLLQGHVEELAFDLLACRRPQLLLGHALLEGEPLVVEADLPEKFFLQSLVGGKRNDPGLFPVDADDGFLFSHVLQDPVQIAQRDPRPHGKPARREPLHPRAPQDHGHPLDVSPRAERLQLHGKPLLCLFLLHGIGVEDLAAAHRADGGVAADHEPVPPHGHDGLFQQQLGVDLLPRLELLPVEKDDAGHDLVGPRVEARERAVFQYPARKS